MLSLVRSSDARYGTSTGTSASHTDGFLDLLADRLLGSVRPVLLSSDTVDFLFRRRRGGRGSSSTSTVSAASQAGASSSSGQTGTSSSSSQAGSSVVGSSGVGGSGGSVAYTGAESTGDGVGVVSAAVDEVSRGVLERFSTSGLVVLTRVVGRFVEVCHADCCL
jgi:cobalamin biosynthesis Mg chelatase CobN